MISLKKKQKRKAYIIKGLLLLSFSVGFFFLFHKPINAQEPPQVLTSHLNLVNDQLDLKYKVYLPNISHTCPCFYIDSNGGSDANSGIQPEKPWKSLSKLNQANLYPGAIVNLKRGSIWTEKLRLYASGQAGKPITITAYGSGTAPIISNPGFTYNEAALYLHGSFYVIDNLLIQDSGSGIAIFSDHNVIQNSEIKNIGEGIVIHGQYNLITRNYIHDTFMIVDTLGGGGDDWGANGIDINNAHNEISYNRFVNCEAHSYDYGMSGGATEIYQQGDYTNLHHNWTFQSQGFIEVSGSGGTGSANNVTISYNVIINSTHFSYIHLPGTPHAINVQNFRVENNTLIDLRAHDPWVSNFIGFAGTPLPDTYYLINNIIYISDYWWVSSFPITHQNNHYYFINGRNKLGFTPVPSEILWVDPQFINLSGYDFHLKPTSPAKNAGINLGYTSDFDLNPVPINNIPDLGAFEYQGN